MKFDRFSFVGVALLPLMVGVASGQRNLRDIPEADPEAELRDFVVAEGFEVNLFAADPMLKKPIGMEFDAEGRLWVSTSAIYPQIKPGQDMTDEVVVLEDTDGDGTADKSTTFADGFLIPTGVLPGDGGVYVGNSTDMIHLRDTDGDGKADEERIVLSGFGTEDTHHIVHAMTWGPTGEMFFNQSIYIHSHIETPYGVRRLDAGGIWRFQPDSLELDVFTRGQVNPWGHVFDEWGQSFTTDGAYGEGVNYAFPGAAYVTAVGTPRILKGLSSGEPKHCGLVRVSGRHFPKEWQGNMLANDFRANRVNRFVITESGSGYAAAKQEDLLRSKRVTFRPISVKMGPDGAVYIADWYNPIIQHGEVDFRDERRDKAHGRIWRVTAKGRPLVERPVITGAPVGDLVKLLEVPEQWTRSWARVELTRRDPEAVVVAINDWLAGLEQSGEEFEKLRLQALWVLQGLDVYDAELLKSVLASKDGRARAAALRAITFGYVPEGEAVAHEAAVGGAEDEHPRARLEAVRALGVNGGDAAVDAALKVLGKPVDRFLDYALWLTVRELEQEWLPGLGEEDAATHPDPGKLLFALRAVSKPTISPLLAGLLRNDRLDVGEKKAVVGLIGALGGRGELDALFGLVMNRDADVGLRVDCLRALGKAKSERGVMPEVDVRGVVTLLGSANAGLRSEAIRVAGVWGLAEASQVLVDLAQSADAEWSVRAAAVEGLAGLGGDQGKQALERIAGSGDAGVRVLAAKTLAKADIGRAAKVVVSLLGDGAMEGKAGELVTALLTRKGGGGVLEKALNGQTISGGAADAAIRAIATTGQTLPGLEAKLRDVGGLEPVGLTMTADEIAAMVKEVESGGDPVKGEAIYRRAGLLCVQCHAIGGAGGRVGPDLVSIGASAPVDYLIESLMEPSKKVKEGYHLTTVTTKDGGVFAGTGARKTDTHLVLVNAANQEQLVPLGSVQSETIGQVSLMPAGLTAGLSRREFVDLTRFLHELGRTPAYSLGEEQVVRRWSARSKVAEDGVAVFSRVGGDLPAESVVEALGGKPRSLLSFDVEVSKPGAVVLGVNDRGGLDRITVGGVILALEAPQVIRFDQAGIQRVEMRVSFAGREERPLRVVVQPAEKGGAEFRVVNGP